MIKQYMEQTTGEYIGAKESLNMSNDLRYSLRLNLKDTKEGNSRIITGKLFHKFGHNRRCCN